MVETLQVKKRNEALEDFNVEKIHKVVEWSCESLAGVHLSDVVMNAQLSVYNGISTDDIHNVLIKSAHDLISEENPNYQYVASRLLLYSLRKKVWGDHSPPRLYDHIKRNAEIYDSFFLEEYTESEIHKIGRLIKHDRDYSFTYAGLQQLIDKYLIKNRNTNVIYETPQFAYILIAMVLFAKYDNRMEHIKKAYDCYSLFKISLPTPIMAGVRTNIRQFSSCVLVNCGDSLDSIFATTAVIGKYTARRAGIGVNMGRIRPIGSPVRGGEVVHTGIIPYLKLLESSVKSTSQNGLRGGSATVTIPFWHYEIEDVLVLKNNAGTDDNRVRKLDYCVSFSRMFYDRLIKNEEITLFSPHEAVGLYDAFGTPEFDDLYMEAERKRYKFKKKVSARKLAELFARERLETGRIYVINIDSVNQSGPFLDKVEMTNLCCEITQPNHPLESEDDEEGEIGICTLSALNLLEVKDDEYEEVCDIAVRTLDAILDYQDYPFKAAANFATKRRSLGIGVTNLAGYLAKLKLGYEDSQAPQVVSDICEKIQYYLLQASCNLARELGQCEKFESTRYFHGKTPVDWYNKSVDDFLVRSRMNWKKLKANIKQYGLRHSTLTAQMPCESSSLIQNATNGMEPVRSLLSYKKAKNGLLKQIVPNIYHCGKYYTKAFDMTSNEPMLRIAAAMQKWFDMALSTNNYYNYAHHGGNIPLSVIIKDLLFAYKYGVKTLYYANTPDGDEEEVTCEGGACSI